MPYPIIPFGNKAKVLAPGGLVDVNGNPIGGGSGNSFETVQTPLGTSPVADASTDTLTLASTDLDITGNATSDTVTIDFNIEAEITRFKKTSKVYNDFTENLPSTTNLYWLAAVASSGSVAVETSTTVLADASGVVRFRTASGNATSAAGVNASTWWVLNASKHKTIVEWRGYPNLVPTATEDFTLMAGLSQGPYGGASLGAYAFFDRTLSTTKWCFRTRNGAGATDTVTSVNLAATTWVVLRVVFDTDGSAKLYIDNTLAATHTTNIPTGVILAPAFGIQNVAATSGAHDWEADYCIGQQQFVTSR